MNYNTELTKPLYPLSGGDAYSRAREALGGASSSFSKMQSGSRSETTGPGKTAGGGIQAGTGGATGGAMTAMALGATYGSAGMWWGAAGGAALGLAAYYLG